MNNLSVKKISYIYNGFAGTEEQLGNLDNLTINTNVEEITGSVVLLNVTNEDKTKQYNTLYFIEENGTGVPINTVIEKHIIDNGNVDNSNGGTEGNVENVQNGDDEPYGEYATVIQHRSPVTVVSGSNVAQQSQEYYIAEQQAAINNISETINSILDVLDNRASVLGIANDSTASTAMQKAQTKAKVVDGAVERVMKDEYAIQVNNIEKEIKDSIAG